MDGFFKQWLYQTAHPVLKLEVNRKRNDMTLDVRQTQEDATFDFPLHLRFEDNKGNVMDREVRVTDREQTFRLDVPKSYKRMTIDPEVRLLGEWELE